MELIHGGKTDDDGPTPDDILDRDMQSPQFASYSALKEVKNLHHIIHAQPRMSHLRELVDAALEVVDRIDDHISGNP